MPSQERGEVLNEVQSRYGYLLKPIRDLFKNWEINIAAELEEYLNEVNVVSLYVSAKKKSTSHFKLHIIKPHTTFIATFHIDDIVPFKDYGTCMQDWEGIKSL